MYTFSTCFRSAHNFQFLEKRSIYKGCEYNAHTNTASCESADGITLTKQCVSDSRSCLDSLQKKISQLDSSENKLEEVGPNENHGKFSDYLSEKVMKTLFKKGFVENGKEFRLNSSGYEITISKGGQILEFDPNMPVAFTSSPSNLTYEELDNGFTITIEFEGEDSTILKAVKRDPKDFGEREGTYEELKPTINALDFIDMKFHEKVQKNADLQVDSKLLPILERAREDGIYLDRENSKSGLKLKTKEGDVIASGNIKYGLNTLLEELEGYYSTSERVGKKLEWIGPNENNGKFSEFLSEEVMKSLSAKGFVEKGIGFSLNSSDYKISISQGKENIAFDPGTLVAFDTPPKKVTYSDIPNGFSIRIQVDGEDDTVLKAVKK